MSEFSKCGCENDQENNVVPQQELNTDKKLTDQDIIAHLEDQINPESIDNTIYNGTVKKNTNLDKVFICEQPKCIHLKPGNKFLTEQNSKSVVIIDSREYSDHDISSTETKCGEKQSTSNELGEKSTKGRKKYYYTKPKSNLLKDFKQLFKIKKKRKQCLKCIKEIENCPENNCAFETEVWERHDKEKCTVESKDYKDIFYQAPGVPIRNSQKSYNINNPEKFRKPGLVKRKYAYPEIVISRCTVEWTKTGQNELEELILLHPDTSIAFGSSNMCK